MTLSLCGNSIHFHCWYVKKLEWNFSTGIAGGIVFSLGIPCKNGTVGKYELYIYTDTNTITLPCSLARTVNEPSQREFDLILEVT